MSKVECVVNQRMKECVSGSYTHRLVNDVFMLRAKLVEEATELGEVRATPFDREKDQKKF